MKKSAPPRAASRPRPPARSLAGPPGEVRLIGGRWKRSKLVVADRPGLRPTPDRVRETLFNWLGRDLTLWRCVDAFAGTGALGFEAASRGAATVLLLEHDAGLVARLLQAKERLAAGMVEVRRGDALLSLERLAPASADLVFIDPPFDAPLFDAALAAASRVVTPGGWVFLEAPREWTDAMLAASGLHVHRHLKAGAVHAHLLGKTPAA